MLYRLALLTSVVFAASRLSAAQPVDQKLELSAGATLANPRLDTTFSTSYVPTIERYSPPDPGSTAGQSLRLSGSSGAGFWTGLNCFFGRHLGVQLLLAYDHLGLAGDNGPYTVVLNYTSKQPPDYTARSYTSSQTSPPCGESAQSGCVSPSAGELRQLSFSANLVGRWALSPRVTGEVSGGLSVLRASARAQPLRYSLYEMGGHATLFSQEYELAYSVGPVRALGVDIGGGIDIGLARGLFLTADARYLAAPAVTAPIVVADVLNRDELTFLQDPRAIQDVLRPPDLRLTLSRSRISVGLKIKR